MGIQTGTGVFLNKELISKTLSKQYCCPSYLAKIKDKGLYADIMEAMNVHDLESQPNYDLYSFNSGYAHKVKSWGNFIDCVAVHEKEKQVVIVLNHLGEFARLSSTEFQEQIFDTKRLNFLKSKGYENILFKGEEQKLSFLQQTNYSHTTRSLTVIVRPSFTPNDMNQIQLASERLLATGDNSAVEAWCARCKLYLYEDVANGGCKWRFLQQQVDAATKFSPNLSRLLALFGNDSRICKSLSESQKMEEIEDLLSDPQLGEDTIQYCNYLTTYYSFDEVLEAALKRTAWQYCIPELAKVEAESVNEGFREGIVNYLKNPEFSGRQLVISNSNILEMGKRVHEVVQQYLQKHS
ncbi:MAG: hypothetical protein K0S74_1439 [Chlamydiales bacterium]|jgi:hypothetical protein|nr:hypothetical protein [Chlamydiales bacterium]